MYSPLCERCSLSKAAISVCVPGKGTGKVLIVGQNPGQYENVANEPFVGKGGTFLRSMLADAGFTEDEYRLTNTVRCMTPLNRPPTPTEVAACSTYLEAEIAEFKPTLIIAMGDTALHALAGRAAMGRVRGTAQPLDARFGHACDVWATWHPSYVMRMQRQRGTVVADLRRAHDASLAVTQFPWKPFAGYAPRFEAAAVISYDVETSFWIDGGDNVIQVAAASDLETFVASTPEDCRALLLALKAFVRYGGTLVGHNSWVADQPWVEKFLGEPFPMGEDTMNLAYLETEGQPLSLESLSVKYLKVRGWKDAKTAPFGSDEFREYNARDAHYTLRLWTELTRLLGSRKKIASRIHLPAFYALGACTERGIQVSKSATTEALAKYSALLGEREAAIRELAPDIENPNSTRQVSAALMAEGHFLPPTEGGELYSTSIDTLTQLRPTPLVAAILAYREVKTKMGTFVQPYHALAHGDGDGRVHTEYGLLRTLTGRTNAKARNVQNLDNELKHFLTAKPGYELLSVDYKALQFRLFAYIANATEILENYRKDPDFDPHLWFAQRMYHKDAITKDERKIAKSGNFGLMFCANPDGFQDYCRNNGVVISSKEAHYTHSMWHHTIPSAMEYYKAIMVELDTNGYVTGVTGQRRHFGDTKGMHRAERAEALREAVNFKVQNLEAHIALTALGLCHNEGLPIVGFVHDDIKFEFPKGESVKHYELITSLMCAEPIRIIEREFGACISVPLAVDFSLQLTCV